MANAGRQYAEGLVGPLDRSLYETQRNVAQQSYNTNWEALQNQYKNLQEQLKKRQANANKDYANGLVQVAENSFDRMNNANANMVNRGLTTSGLNNLVQQSDTTQKGEEIAKLLKSAGDVATKTAEQLKNGNTTVASKEASLNKGLGDTLGNIGAKETSAQMSYNAGLAGIAGNKDARDMENALASAQREASATASGYNTKEQDEELNDFYKKVAINDLLNTKDMSDRQKANSLSILFEKRNADDIVSGFNKNVTATETYNKKLKELEKEKKKVDSAINNKKVIDIVNENGTTEQKLLNQLLRNGEDKLFDKTGQSQTLVDYLNQMYSLQGKNALPSISEEQARQALNRIVGPTGDLPYIGYQTEDNPFVINNTNNGKVSLEDLVNTYNAYKSGETPLLGQQISSGITANKNAANNAYDNYKKQGITYEDLARLLYGKN